MSRPLAAPRPCYHGATETPSRCFHLDIGFPNPVGFATSHSFQAHSIRRRTHPPGSNGEHRRHPAVTRGGVILSDGLILPS